jgi:hypothetical protein
MINIFDSVLIEKAVAGYPNIDPTNADVNLDTAVNALDIVRFSQYLIGLWDLPDACFGK